MQPSLDLLDHPLVVVGAQLDQELAAVQYALVILADNWDIPLRRPSEAQVVGGRADIAPPDNDLGRLSALVALVAKQREGLTLLNLGVAEVGERGQQ